MRFNFREGFVVGGIVALALGIYLARLWQPERQVRLHAMHLMANIREQELDEGAGFIGADFQDDWGDDRDRLLARYGKSSVTLTA